jgi:alkylation response protein AidB-like acyl-CoA dehydrogenase
VFGTKIFITYGEHDLTENIIHLVLARVAGAPEGVKGISLFVVPKFLVNADGSLGARNDVHCVSIEHKLGIKASPTAVLQYGDHGGAIGYLVGEENHGLEYMFVMMNAARYGVGVQGIAVAERAYQQAVAYARERVQSRPIDGSTKDAVPIIEHPDVRRMLMTMRALTEGCRALATVTAAAWDAVHNHPDAAARQQMQMFYEFAVPPVKGFSTETSVEVASLGVQVHGGMGFIEETGAAQHFRDARITPIYEGTNGIQAADLVGRKLAMEDGGVLFALLDEMREETRNSELEAMIEVVEDVARSLLAAGPDDRLAASTPFLTLLSVVVCGWLMEKQGRIAERSGNDPFLRNKAVAARFYVGQIVPEAYGLRAAALAKADLLYALGAEDF